MQKNITKLGAVLRPNTPNITYLFSKIKEDFAKEKIEVILEEESQQETINTTFLPFETLVKQVDAMISIGGDGTLISLLRKLYPYSISAFGINIGNLGFLTAINPSQSIEFAAALRQGRYKLNAHTTLEASINNGPKKIAINEFLISKNNLVSGILKIQAFIDSEIFNTYHADSLIIATPTGSTAYNISAGGPIVYPLCKNILLTPVAAHTLTQRPMVLHECTLQFKINMQGFLIIDGQDKIPITPDDITTIKIAQNPSYLLQKENRSYFQILKEKFQWGQQ
ncbi:NAD(+)/NADH kinase [Helicobacter anatolicus]|uniref:NAD(+)/NADH kinase n=1 Tax=Helicobacter anatolicus TaxID=2905874 RepID=UPI001E3EED8B|nr:NAD(+)/NADH kinase [Helicobacter anatolicus]MCE3038142.1 NAD(+)/NADH kinase [Helicobacter anatolicus]